MGDYVTAADIQTFIGLEILIQLTDDEGDGNVNTPVVDETISIAEGELHARSGKGFIVPVTVSQHGQRAYDAMVALTKICVRYHLYLRRPNLMTQAYIDSHTAALDDMDKMAKGGLALPGPVARDSAETQATTHTTVATKSSSDRPSTRKWTRESQGNA